MDYKASFFSPGKLLITGEYLVIDGAKALALPTKKGQWLRVNPSSLNEISWTSIDHNGKIWFEAKYGCKDFTILSCSDEGIALKLQEILSASRALDNTDQLSQGWTMQTELDFPNNWGLGSSSTLLCNLSKWLKIDAYKLHFAVSNGSGYDIACGMESAALTYTVQHQDAQIEKISFQPKFTKNIYFIHLNQKQKSDVEVGKYAELKKELNLAELTSELTRITENVLLAEELTRFEELLSEHEQILSHILQRETSQESLFQLYKGGITKYLGAWGGDFVLVTARLESDLIYFREKGYQTILSFDEMILVSN